MARKRRGRLKKGSPEAKAWGRKMRALRGGKAKKGRKRRRKATPEVYGKKITGYGGY